ncbi:uncharacterized protein LOC113325254 [Papaver somniferum]|uniref:uncharacterized protein LOC113325254 n=1 Tax=Papaver somniferum TaxID=3469 RepID=UPI000E6FC17F|nr:uncharacterized protein LOC113325254 [Papaver somniferum]
MLHNQLSGVRKGNLSILVYLHNVKSLGDSLAAIGERVSETFLTMYVLNGLGRAYDNFVISANNRETPFTFAELKPRLMNHEQWLLDKEQDMSINFDSQHPSAFYSRNGNNFGGGNKNKPKFNPNNFVNSQFQSGSSSNSNSQGGYNGGYSGGVPKMGGPSNSGGRRTQIDFSKVECQICRKFGHFANRCYYRYASDKKQNNNHSAYIASEEDGFHYMDPSANIATMDQAFSSMTMQNPTMSDPS